MNRELSAHAELDLWLKEIKEERDALNAQLGVLSVSVGNKKNSLTKKEAESEELRQQITSEMKRQEVITAELNELARTESLIKDRLKEDEVETPVDETEPTEPVEDDNIDGEQEHLE